VATGIGAGERGGYSGDAGAADTDADRNANCDAHGHAEFDAVGHTECDTIGHAVYDAFSYTDNDAVRYAIGHAVCDAERDAVAYAVHNAVCHANVDREQLLPHSRRHGLRRSHLRGYRLRSRSVLLQQSVGQQMCRRGEHFLSGLRRSHPHAERDTHSYAERDTHGYAHADPNTRAKHVDGSRIGNCHARASVPTAGSFDDLDALA